MYLFNIINAVNPIKMQGASITVIFMIYNFTYRDFTAVYNTLPFIYKDNIMHLHEQFPTVLMLKTGWFPCFPRVSSFLQ